MIGTLGASFMPSDDPTAKPASGSEPVSEAVKILALRLPKVAGAKSALAPESILGESALARPSAYRGPDAIVQDVLGRVLSEENGGSVNPPKPVVIPGGGGTTSLVQPTPEPTTGRMPGPAVNGGWGRRGY